MLATVGFVPPLNINFALSILEKLQVPEGWCSSGFNANEYTLIPLFDGIFSWCWNGCTKLKYLPSRVAKRSLPFNVNLALAHKLAPPWDDIAVKTLAVVESTKASVVPSIEWEALSV